ncbi:apolipoprotein N-acyltransferase [Undibacterium sp. GrIS 1.2]|uniref:nitrilase-related carbon-nitrogen hydrolase n=1 Tax=Undibacterium sp. GrIS 1.2 TaxID=3143933 RepID=UPI00339B05E2
MQSLFKLITKPSTRSFILQFSAALLIGFMLRFVVNLTPVWWLVWIAPVPLLVIALRSNKRDTFWITAVAASIGLSSNLHYYQLVMPAPIAVLVLLAQSWLWVLVIMTTRRLVLRYQSWWTVLVYPVVWCAVDTLLAHCLPDGNWGSLAYSQTEFLPMLQVTSLFGVAGLLFLLALFPSAIALAFVYGRRLHHVPWAYGLTTLLLIATFTYGEFRLQDPSGKQQVVFGLVSIDDAIGLQASATYAASIWQQYDRHVATLAAQGAKIIVLPEKIAMLTPANAEQLKRYLSSVAKAHHVWIIAGSAIDDGSRPSNLAWMFSPLGILTNNYQKHHLAPPERDYATGVDYQTKVIDATLYGLAICKDMHFASLGRAYTERNVGVMLVPAWDFYFDQWIASRTTLIRGVESGYIVVRSAREGLLTVSDAYGRVLAEKPSSGMPGQTLLVKTNIAARLTTLYSIIGGLFGWLCVLCLVGMAAWPVASAYLRAYKALPNSNLGDASI